MTFAESHCSTDHQLRRLSCSHHGGSAQAWPVQQGSVQASIPSSSTWVLILPRSQWPLILAIMCLIVCPTSGLSPTSKHVLNFSECQPYQPSLSTRLLSQRPSSGDQELLLGSSHPSTQPEQVNSSYLTFVIASLAGKKSEELEELQVESKADHSKLTFSQRIKVYIYEILQKNAFITILLLASVRFTKINIPLGSKSTVRPGRFPLRPLLGPVCNFLRSNLHR